MASNPLAPKPSTWEAATKDLFASAAAESTKPAARLPLLHSQYAANITKYAYAVPIVSLSIRNACKDWLLVRAPDAHFCDLREAVESRLDVLRLRHLRPEDQRLLVPLTSAGLDTEVLLQRHAPVHVCGNCTIPCPLSDVPRFGCCNFARFGFCASTCSFSHIEASVEGHLWLHPRSQEPAFGHAYVSLALRQLQPDVDEIAKLIDTKRPRVVAVSNAAPHRRDIPHSHDQPLRTQPRPRDA
jgi:hypothetical protein